MRRAFVQSISPYSIPQIEFSSVPLTKSSHKELNKTRIHLQERETKKKIIKSVPRRGAETFPNWRGFNRKIWYRKSLIFGLCRNGLVNPNFIITATVHRRTEGNNKEKGKIFFFCKGREDGRGVRGESPPLGENKSYNIFRFDLANLFFVSVGSLLWREKDGPRTAEIMGRGIRINWTSWRGRNTRMRDIVIGGFF